MWEYNYTYLEHHGIGGQHWGVRNGPPYPLDAKTHARVVKKKRGDVKRHINESITNSTTLKRKNKIGSPKTDERMANLYKSDNSENSVLAFCLRRKGYDVCAKPARRQMDGYDFGFNKVGIKQNTLNSGYDTYRPTAIGDLKTKISENTKSGDVGAVKTHNYFNGQKEYTFAFENNKGKINFYNPHEPLVSAESRIKKELHTNNVSSFFYTSLDLSSPDKRVFKMVKNHQKEI